MIVNKDKDADTQVVFIVKRYKVLMFNVLEKHKVLN